MCVVGDVTHDAVQDVARKTGSAAWNNNQWYNNQVRDLKSSSLEA